MEKKIEKFLSVVAVVATFFVFFAVLQAWDIHVSVRMIFSAMFAAIFGYIFFRPSKKKANE